MEFLEKESPVDVNEFGKVRVIKKRSFIKVSPEQAEQVVEAIKGKMINGKRIRASVAVDTGYEPSRSDRRGHNSRGRGSSRREGRGSSRMNGRR